jgi:hypothetical protein
MFGEEICRYGQLHLHLFGQLRTVLDGGSLPKRCLASPISGRHQATSQKGFLHCTWPRPLQMTAGTSRCRPQCAWRLGATWGERHLLCGLCLLAPAGGRPRVRFCTPLGASCQGAIVRAQQLATSEPGGLCHRLGEGQGAVESSHRVTPAVLDWYSAVLAGHSRQGAALSPKRIVHQVRITLELPFTSVRPPQETQFRDRSPSDGRPVHTDLIQWLPAHRGSLFDFLSFLPTSCAKQLRSMASAMVTARRLLLGLNHVTNSHAHEADADHAMHEADHEVHERCGSHRSPPFPPPASTVLVPPPAYRFWMLAIGDLRHPARIATQSPCSAH